MNGSVILQIPMVANIFKWYRRIHIIPSEGVFKCQSYFQFTRRFKIGQKSTNDPDYM